MQGTHDVRKWGYQDANVFFRGRLEIYSVQNVR